MSKRKKPVRARGIFLFYLAVTFGGMLLHGLLFNIQENFYTGINGWYDWYVQAGVWQLSLTSATAVFFSTGILLVIILIISDFQYTTKIRRFLLGVIFVGLVIYAGYETYQAITQPYFDHNFLDIVVAAGASLFLALPAIMIRPTD